MDGEVSYRIGEKGLGIINYLMIIKYLFWFLVEILYEDERRLLRNNTNKDSLYSESSSDSEEPFHHGKNWSYEECLNFY